MRLCQNTVLMNEYLILTKFRNYWIKIVDFLTKAYFCLVSLINEQSLYESRDKGGGGYKLCYVITSTCAYINLGIHLSFKK